MNGLVSTRTFTDNDWHHFMVTWMMITPITPICSLTAPYETTVKTGTTVGILVISPRRFRVSRIGAESDGDNPLPAR